jgi:hypothetical protein
MSKDETGKPIKTTPAMSFDLACYCASQAACANSCNSFIKYPLQTFRVTTRYLKEVFVFYQHVTSIA